LLLFLSVDYVAVDMGLRPMPEAREVLVTEVCEVGACSLSSFGKEISEEVCGNGGAWWASMRSQGYIFAWSKPETIRRAMTVLCIISG
jgi:hypothetical protein